MKLPKTSFTVRAQGSQRVVSAQPVWPTWTVFAVVVLALAITVVGGLLVAILVAATGGDSQALPPWAVTVAAVAQQLGMLTAPVLTAAMVYKVRKPLASDFGLRKFQLFRSLIWMLLAWLTFVLFTAVWTAVLGAEESSSDLLEKLGADDGVLLTVTAAAVVAVGAPIAEEVLFRGFIFSALRGRFGVWPAAAITGALFGSVHYSSAPVVFLLPLAVFGGLLCLLYYRTGSLLPPILLHSLNNCYAFGVGVSWSWQIPVLMVGALLVILALTKPFYKKFPALKGGLKRLDAEG